MVTLAVYEKFTRNHLFRGTVDFAAVSMKAMLVTSYTYGQLHEFRADIAGEASGAGYTAGGVAMTGTGILDVSDTDWLVAVDADDTTFAGITVSGITGVITYIDTGSAATDPLVTYHAFGPLNAVGDDLVIEWHNIGVLSGWM